MANLIGSIFEELGPALQRTGMQIGARQERAQTRKAEILLDALSRAESGRRFDLTYAQNQARLKQDRELADRIFKLNVGKFYAGVSERAGKTIEKRDIATRKATAEEEKRLTGIETKKTQEEQETINELIKSFYGKQFAGPSFSDYAKIIAEKPVTGPGSELSDAEYFQKVSTGFGEIGGGDIETLLEAIRAIKGQFDGKKSKIPTQQEIEAMTPEERSALLESFSRQ